MMEFVFCLFFFFLVYLKGEEISNTRGTCLGVERVRVGGRWEGEMFPRLNLQSSYDLGKGRAFIIWPQVPGEGSMSWGRGHFI